MDCHRCEKKPQIFLRVTEGLLSQEQSLGVRLVEHRDFRQILERDDVFAKPGHVGLGAGNLALDFFVRDNSFSIEIEQEHFAGLKPPLFLDLLGRNVEHPDLGSQNHQAIRGDAVPAGPKAIAIEHRTDVSPIGKRHRGRPIPGLHQVRVVFVKRLFLLNHEIVTIPGFRDHHHHGVRQRAAAHDEQFEDIVKDRRIAAAFIDDRKELLDVVAEQGRGQHPFAGPHPVDVSPQRIDFAVMADVAIGMTRFQLGNVLVLNRE